MNKRPSKYYKVLTYDEETGEQAYKPVVQLFRNETKEWYHVRMNDEEIICTGGHPFYVLNAEEDRKVVEFEGVKASGTGTWICAKELKVSDQVLLLDGSCAIIEEIQVEKLSEPETTYNFEVADFHTYYVSDSKVLVHNMCAKSNRVESKIDDKISKQMDRRGWSKDMIDDVVNDPYTTRSALNKANNNPATAFYNKAGDYVVRDNITEKIIQISKYGDRGWIPDSTIINPYRPGG